MNYKFFRRSDFLTFRDPTNFWIFVGANSLSCEWRKRIPLRANIARVPKDCSPGAHFIATGKLLQHGAKGSDSYLVADSIQCN
jgi:hypothetical protein